MSAAAASARALLDAQDAGGTDVALRDGGTVRVRPVRAADEAGLLAFLEELSDRSRLLRFFSAGSNLRGEAHLFAQADGQRRHALVALAGPQQRIVGHGMYVAAGTGKAETAFAIADAYQGRGLGTILLAHLAAHARAAGIETFVAITRSDNRRMLDVFRESGYPVEVRAGADTVDVSFPTELTPAGWQRFEQREQSTSVAAVRRILEPSAVALVGASRRRGSVGGEILHNLLSTGFEGVIYAVNPSATSVQSIPAYPSMADLPGPVDLAVIAVPAADVADVARQCGQAGVGALVVISAGFAEVAGKGPARQRELVEICREYGMRLVGPNCLGVLNTASGVHLDATFIPSLPQPGRVAFLSQSGGLGIAIVDAANRLHLGLSAFVSIGNKADLSGNDFLQYWEQDPNTSVILLYLESFGNARKFARIARRVGRVKPILAVKSGRSAAGARASSSHTGALLAASDVTVDALFRQAGVIRTDTLAELFDVAALLSSQPPPRGSRVAIVTNAGGPGILCADACEASGLEVAALPAVLCARLRRFLSAEASVGNPLDMVATATADDYKRAIEAIARADVADAIIVIFVPPLVTEATDVAAAISKAAERIPAEVTIASVFMAKGDGEVILRRGEQAIPLYTFPEDAARALGHAARYGAWRSAPAGAVAAFADVRREQAAAVIARALGRGEDWLDQREVEELLECYGIPRPLQRFAADPDTAEQAAAELGGTLALKVLAPGLIHKSDAGAVATGLRPVEIKATALALEKAVREAGFQPSGFQIQAMAPRGVELIIGVVQDRAFGPLVACGAGGTSAELLGDVAARLTPLSDLDAAEMLRGMRLFPLLDGYRGAQRCDVAALEEMLLRVSALVEAHPEVAELDLNPVVALGDGALAVDARVRVETAPREPVRPSLRA
ncbi:MAG TPA: GNAT family N-acetyltransferase [Solirubrobacteraceae bacterium]|jgi:acetyl coenzyme A synthetase (ADP forming)-like protein